MKRIRNTVNIIVLLYIVLIYGCADTKQHLEIGIFSGSVWNVPYWQNYKFIDKAIDKFTD
ncbi:MAG: hypothetical protein L3J12_08080 [Spirochaetales bacterium]|nr:hypothetical protein [Spirochaetales bacterium]